MRTTALGLAFLVVTSSACVFGRSPASKRKAYVANGAAVVVGAASLLLRGYSSPSSCGDRDGCWEISGPSFTSPTSRTALTAFGAFMLGVGTTGIAINAFLPAQRPEAAPLAPARRATIDARVTGPGLRPAIVPIR